jgi:transposase-like protein
LRRLPDHLLHNDRRFEDASKSKKTTRRRHRREFKAEAATLVMKQGLSRAQVARDLGISSGLIDRWVQTAEEATGSVRALCAPLGVSRSASYDWRLGRLAERAGEDAILAVHIKAAHRRSQGTYGATRNTADLVAEAHEVGRGRVARLMAANGLAGTPKRPFRGQTTDSDQDDRIADNILDRQFNPNGPNDVSVSDIAYRPARTG